MTYIKAKFEEMSLHNTGDLVLFEQIAVNASSYTRKSNKIKMVPRFFYRSKKQEPWDNSKLFQLILYRLHKIDKITQNKL